MADIDIAELVATHIGDRDELGFRDITITRSTPGVRDPLNLAGGTQPTTATFTGRGSLEREGRFMDGTLVAQDHVLISVLGGTVSDGAVPQRGDVITFGGVAYRVTRVPSDQVGAVYECEAK